MEWLLDSKDSLTLDGILWRPKKKKPHFQNMGFFFVGSGHGPELSCQVSVCYNFFSGFRCFLSYIYQTISFGYVTILKQTSLAAAKTNCIIQCNKQRRMIVLVEIVIEEVAALLLYKLKIEFPAVKNSLQSAFNKRSFKFELMFVSEQSFANLRIEQFH